MSAPASPTRVCMLAYTNYASDARVRREAEALCAEKDFQVDFFSLKENGKPRQYRLNGVRVHELDISKYQGKSRCRYILFYSRFWLAAAAALNRMLKKGQLDIVHVHNMPNFMVFTAILPRLRGKPVVLDMHDTIPETYVSKFGESSQKDILFRLLCLEERLCCALANKVFCVNQVQRDTLVARGLNPEKSLVLLNVPDPKIFYQPVPDKDRPDNGRKFKLVYHGTITKRLGIDLAIRAVEQLKKDIGNLEFWVVGKGDDLEEFISLSQELGIGDQVHFGKEMVPLENLRNLICDMDVGIIANRRDPATELMLPVKMLEYIALGIPVVAPELKTIRHYFDETMVCFFTPEDVDSLANAINCLYRDKTRKENQIQSAGGFLENYGWETHKHQLIDMYRELR